MATATEHPKAREVQALADRLAQAPVIGLAGIEGIPAPQMQHIRAKLRGRLDFRIVKNRLLQRALEAAARERAGLAGLEAYLTGPTALVTTEQNPFRLYRELEATKTKAPARGGEVAPEEIVVREGDTPFKPGPVVGDLQKAGIPAAIERGKVVIKKDKVLVEAGQRIPPVVARALTRLEILPLTVGLDVRGVFEDGQLYTPEHLAVDEAALRGDLAAAAAQAYHLALEVAYPTIRTTGPLLAQARREALALAWAVEYPTNEVLPRLLAAAHAQMTALAARMPEERDEELRTPVGGSPKEEEPPTDEERKKEPEKKAKDEGADDEEAADDLSSLSGRRSRR